MALKNSSIFVLPAHRENRIFVNFVLCFLVFNIIIYTEVIGDLSKLNRPPIHFLFNEHTAPSLINSVDFHPTTNLFCVTFTQNNRVILYKIDQSNNVDIVQILQNNSAKLSFPQHAIFSKNGRNLVIANWYNQTFNIYKQNSEGLYQPEPISIIPFPPPTDKFRPHGIAFSPDGDYLAVAFGASKKFPKAIGLYQIHILEGERWNFELVDLLQGNEIEIGIPKGITFSPDGSCLLLTLSETNSVAVYTLDFFNKKIIPTPRQVLKGASPHLSRPEDLKFTAEGCYFAVSNSDKNNITFYSFDKENNSIISNSPVYIIRNPEGHLSFPHGLAFSSDGDYLLVTQFGTVRFNKNGDLLYWGKKRGDSVAIYKLR